VPTSPSMGNAFLAASLSSARIKPKYSRKRSRSNSWNPRHDRAEASRRQLAIEPDLRREHADDPLYLRALAGRHAVFYLIESDRPIPVVRCILAAILDHIQRDLDRFLAILADSVGATGMED